MATDRSEPLAERQPGRPSRARRIDYKSLLGGALSQNDPPNARPAPASSGKRGGGGGDGCAHKASPAAAAASAPAQAAEPAAPPQQQHQQVRPSKQPRSHKRQRVLVDVHGGGSVAGGSRAQPTQPENEYEQQVCVCVGGGGG